jgi:hypothetical protein
MAMEIFPVPDSRGCNISRVKASPPLVLLIDFIRRAMHNLAFVTMFCQVFSINSVTRVPKYPFII